MIAIVDYGAGNLTSVVKAFETLGAAPQVVREAAHIRGARAVVVPGVGHFDATRALGSDWRDALADHLREGRPLLGICLGMQWLFEGSTEAPGCPGLGILPGRCARLSPEDPPGGGRFKVPHVGWNAIQPIARSSALAGIPAPTWVYFTHSYAAPVGEDCVAVADHGGRFAAVVERNRVWGVQFHPEKSGEIGLAILRNFLQQ